MGIAEFALLAALIWGEFGGLYHSFTKHGGGDTALAFLVPPFAFYRSIEFFWHDDGCLE